MTDRLELSVSLSDREILVNRMSISKSLKYERDLRVPSAFAMLFNPLIFIPLELDKIHAVIYIFLGCLSPSIHNYGDVFIHSGLSAARNEPLGLEPFDELRVSSRDKKLGAERLGRVE